MSAGFHRAARTAPICSFSNTATGGQGWYVGSVGASQPVGESAGDFHKGIPGIGSWFLIDTAGELEG
jgi:hypothetical protein